LNKEPHRFRALKSDLANEEEKSCPLSLHRGSREFEVLATEF